MRPQRFPDVRRLIGAGAACAFLCQLAPAGQQEVAALQATVLPGSLEIETQSVDLFYSVEGFQSAAVDQVDAVSFQISGLTLNDLNGDGLGWRLTVSPEPLVFGSAQLELGTEEGFFNFSQGHQLSTPDSNELLCSDADGVAGLTVDYRLRYTIPAFAPAGPYQGKVTFTIVAE